MTMGIFYMNLIARSGTYFLGCGFLCWSILNVFLVEQTLKTLKMMIDLAQFFLNASHQQRCRKVSLEYFG